MTNIIDLETYRVARTLINALDGRAAIHAETMVKRMAKRHDDDGEVQWRRIRDAISKLNGVGALVLLPHR